MPRARAVKPLPERIVDAALAAGEEVGWAQLRLFDVAARLGVGLDEVREHFIDLDAVGDAWLKRGEKAMLHARSARGFERLAAKERIFRVIAAFLGALARHRRVTGEIFRQKLYFGHPHHNFALVLWISRTVQWVREAALLRNDVGGERLGDLRRRVEESGLSALFVATIVFWLADESPGQERTHAFLRARLSDADRLMARLFPSGARN